MEANFSLYSYLESIERISQILDSSDASYVDRKGIPPRTSLTFNNGFYVDVTVVFVDMRGSKELAAKHTRPVLAKIYRAYISELVAVFKGDPTISEIYIEGDGVWAVFDTTTLPQVNTVFGTAAQVASLTDILNIKLKKKGYSAIKVGIGIDDGESLYIKAGYNGSGINEVVWIGKVVGGAAKLCKDANRGWFGQRLLTSKKIYSYLTDQNKKLLSYDSTMDCYTGNVVSVQMNDWVIANE